MPKRIITICLTALLLAASLPTAILAASFTDVPDSNPYKSEIEYLADIGVINGRSEGVFAPDAEMTRAEFATITVRALGLVPRSNDAFLDVTEDKWYSAYVGTAYSYGIVNGVDEEHFSPNSNVTHYQAYLMVYRASKLTEKPWNIESSDKTPITRGEIAKLVYGMLDNAGRIGNTSAEPESVTIEPAAEDAEDEATDIADI